MSQNRLNGKSAKNVIVIEKSELNDAIKDGKKLESIFVLQNCDIKLDNIQPSTLNQGKLYQFSITVGVAGFCFAHLPF